MEFYQKFSSKISYNIRRLSKNSRSRYGIPFVLFIVLGSFGLKEFTEIRYKYREGGVMIRDEAKKAGIQMKKPSEVTIDKVYESIKDIDIEHWENKRGPRPWEESTS